MMRISEIAYQEYSVHSNCSMNVMFLLVTPPFQPSNPKASHILPGLVVNTIQQSPGRGEFGEATQVSGPPLIVSGRFGAGCALIIYELAVKSLTPLFYFYLQCSPSGRLPDGNQHFCQSWHGLRGSAVLSAALAKLH